MTRRKITHTSSTQTCRASHSVVKSRYLWLDLLHGLDQAQAPNLPLHADLDALTCDEIRKLVVKAIQGYLKIKNERLCSLNNEVYVELFDIPGNKSLTAKGSPDLFPHSNRDNVRLLPGGTHLIVQWSHGYIQIVDIATHGAIWTYPNDITPDDCQDDLLVSSYNLDAREDGFVTLMVLLNRPGEVPISKRTWLSLHLPVTSSSDALSRGSGGISHSRREPQAVHENRPNFYVRLRFCVR